MAVYHGLTGQLQSVLGVHDGLVYSICWSPDDSAVVTASADLTTKVWFIPHLTAAGGTVGRAGWAGPGAGTLGSSQSPVLTQRTAPSSATGGGEVAQAGASSAGADAAAHTAAWQGLAAGGGAAFDVAAPSTLQHACYVYCAEFCPLAGLGSSIVVTGGFDGVLRLWDAHRGLLLCGTQVGLVSGCCAPACSWR